MFLVQHPEHYDAERAYVLDLVLTRSLGLQWTARAETRTDVLLSVPAFNDDRSITVADRLFATPQADWLTQASLPSSPLERWQTGDCPLSPTLAASEVPVIFGETLTNGSFFEETERAVKLGVDIFGSVFFQLTRYEEVVRQERDAHGRFPAAASLSLQEGFLRRPLADEYTEILWAAIRRLWPAIPRKPRAFREHISHDVDSHLYLAPSVPSLARTTLGDVARRHDPTLAFTRLRSSLGSTPAKRNPYNKFAFLMDLSERRGVRSAFNFIAGTTAPGQDGSYDISDPWIGELIEQIDKRGHEVGLHPSYNTFQSPGRIAAEYNALVRICESRGISQTPIGGRQHFLRWENPTTWRGWEQAGLSYDSTLGFPRNPGFRCGTCTAYPVFDLLERRCMRLHERPLIAMEIAIVDDIHLDDENAVCEFQMLRETCRRFAGEFTLLWHNSRLACSRDQRLYTAVVLEQD